MQPFLNEEKQDESSQFPDNALNMIAEAHFDRFSKLNINSLIESWDEFEMKDEALRCLYYAANHDLRDFEEYIAKTYEDFGEDAKCVLKTMCLQASGAIEDDDPVFMQCKKLSSLDSEKIKSDIGGFFRVNMNQYLLEIEPELYKKSMEEFSVGSSSFMDGIVAQSDSANVNNPGPSLEKASASPLLEGNYLAMEQ